MIAALGHLLTPASFSALQNHAATTKYKEQKEVCASYVSEIEGRLPHDYAMRSPLDKEAVLAGIRNEKYTLKPRERTITHKQLIEAGNEWTAKNRIEGGKYGWVEVKHILAAASADDIDLLLTAKASFYGRLSDECLYETRMIDEAVKQLGRTRYRKPVGIN